MIWPQFLLTRGLILYTEILKGKVLQANCMASTKPRAPNSIQKQSIEMVVIKIVVVVADRLVVNSNNN